MTATTAITERLAAALADRYRVERFVVEIKTTAALSHPHILPLFDSGTADGFLYYVMPYIEGETIRERLNRETQFGVEAAVRIAGEVADALDYAHRHGVIHRDITERSDTYSLASVLYEMLTGEPPHMGTSAQQSIMKIIAEPVKPATELRKSVPAHVAAALGKAREKLPADRFESAKAFAGWWMRRGVGMICSWYRSPGIR